MFGNLIFLLVLQNATIICRRLQDAICCINTNLFTLRNFAYGARRQSKHKLECLLYKSFACIGLEILGFIHTRPLGAAQEMQDQSIFFYRLVQTKHITLRVTLNSTARAAVHSVEIRYHFNKGGKTRMYLAAVAFLLLTDVFTVLVVLLKNCSLYLNSVSNLVNHAKVGTHFLPVSKSSILCDAYTCNLQQFFKKYFNRQQALSNEAITVSTRQPT